MKTILTSRRALWIAGALLLGTGLARADIVGTFTAGGFTSGTFVGAAGQSSIGRSSDGIQQRGLITTNVPPTLSINTVTQNEGDSGTSTMTFTVTRTGDTTSASTVTYTTSNGTATAGSDYTAIADTTLTFAPTETTKTIDVLVTGDQGLEPNETFNVTLSAPTNATITTATGLGTIVNDDSGLVVTTTSDTINGNDNDNSLREAVITANSLASNDAITFSSLFDTAQTITLTGGELTLSNNGTLTITGPSASVVTVSGNNASRTLNVGSGLTARVLNLTLTGGKTPAGNYGGAITNAGTLTVTNCSFAGNTADSFCGGAIYSSSSLTVNNCTFTGNTSTGTGDVSGNGGAIYSDAVATLVVNNSTFSSNSAGVSGIKDGFGGAILAQGGTSTLIGCTFSGNTVAANGGAIFNQNPATLTVTNCTFGGANTAGTSGGAIYLVGGTVTVTGSTVSGNTANYNGGGICNEASTLTVTSSTLSGNTANSVGGGFYNSGTLTVTNSTLSGNMAPNAAGVDGNSGGALYNDNTATFNSSTIAGNSANGGGGVSSPSSTTFSNTIVAGNTDNNGFPDTVGSSISQGYNLIGNANGNFNTQSTDQVGTPANVIDARLGALANNGGPTQTMAILAGSAAIDAGSNPDNLDFDQRGTPHARVKGRAADIGAYESDFISEAPSLVVTTPSDSGTRSDNLTSLREAIAYANSGNAGGNPPITFDESAAAGGNPAGAFATAQTITLRSALPNLNHDMTITGPAAGVTVSGANAYQIFNITGGTVGLEKLTLANGLGTAGYTGADDFDGHNGYVGDNGGGGSGAVGVSGGSLSLTNCTVAGNTGGNGGTGGNGANTGGNGGNGAGALSVSGGSLSLNNCTVAGNTSGQGGQGGYNLFGGGNGGNGIGVGGGIYNINSGTVTVTNSTLSGNTANSGGGIFNSGTLTVMGSTISGNTASYGGGIDSDGPLNLSNSIVAGNSADTNGPDIRSTVTSGGYNLIGQRDGSGGYVASDQTGTIAAPLDPKLGALANNGGPTQTIALLPGSPAINTGSNTGAPATDQRGIARPQQGTVDIGAFESRGFTLTKTGGDNQSANLNRAFATPLGVTVTSPFGEPVNGGTITFTPPGSGASAGLSPNPATISGGDASSTATANGIGGTYSVSATAGDAASAATFTLTNVNQAPVITSNGGGATASKSVAENTTTVTTVTATDADTPAQTLTYSISGGADAAKFSIVGTTGVLTFITAPDFEAPTDVGANNIYDVTVQVSDNGTPVASDTQALSITVTNVNEAPVITSNGGGATASKSVAENTTTVTTVTANDVDSTNLAYSISGGADAALFSIDATSGVLSFVTAPNFEVPTDVGGNNIYKVTVQVSDDGTPVASDTQALSITVTDANDAPVITSNGGGDTASKSVAENTTTVTTVMATDADLPAQTLTYSISGGADAALFSIDSTSGVLRFVTAPDFEAPTDANADNMYQVTVQVSDDGTPVASDSQALSITVTNVNEAPVAVDDDYTGNFGTTLTVPAPGVLANDTDPDLGDTRGVADHDPGTPAIDPVTGPAHGTLVLHADGGFSYTPNPAFFGDDSFTYQATDGALLSNIATVTIHVAANTPPTANADTATTNEDTLVDIDVIANDTDAESANANLLVAPGSITAVTGGSAVLQGDNRTVRFTPDSNANDGNTPGGFSFSYRASDGTSSSLTAATVTISVTAINDAPVITSNGGGATASKSVAENTTTVTTVTASDVDSTNLTYSISGGADAALFSIDPTSGVLHFITAPDFENPTDAGGNNVYGVTVQVSDDGTPVASDTQALSITVTDVNDAPVITSNGGGATAAKGVAENTTTVTTVTATDADLPAQSLTYSISGGADAALFSIDPTSGVLHFITAPDFEAPADANADNVYKVTVQVSDNGTPVASDTQALSITVTDVNDAPVITSNGGGDTASKSIAENTTTVTTVTATDADLPAQSLTYSISGGADAALFSIDPTSGVLSFTTAPDFEAPADANTDNVYEVTVQVSDDGTPVASDTQALSITVTDVNDAPVITSNGGGATAAKGVAENTTTVTTVTATDADLPAQTLTYSISGGADAALFSIDPTSGVLHFITAPDFEAPADANTDNVYEVRVKVSDDGTPVASDTQALSISVTNVNEAPVITSNGGGATASKSVAENTTAVTTVTATDVDSTQLTYSISGADAALFSINSASGVLSFITAPDFEAPADADHNNVYQVTVVATDNGTPNLHDTQALSITVINVNEAPVLDLNGSDGAGRNFAATFTEGGAAVPIVDSDLTATDVDSPKLAFATVTLTNRQDGANEILEATPSGTLTAAHIHYSAGVLSITGVAPIADYQAVLRSVTYRDTAVETNATARVVSFVINDGTSNSPAASSTVNIAVVHDAPMVDLNGPGVAGADFAATFTEDGASVFLEDTAKATITDVDSATLTGATVKLVGLRDGSDEKLFVTTTGTNIVFAYDSGSGTLTLWHTAPVADYQQVLRSLKYRDNSQSPTTTARRVAISVNDGTLSSQAASCTLTVVAQNDAPVLDDSGNPTLNSVAQGATNNPGTLVSKIISSVAPLDMITDVDRGAVEGIAVTAVETVHGSWQFSLDAGTTWTDVGAVSGTSALLLASDSKTKLRFVVAPGYVGYATVRFKAWDQTAGSNGGRLNPSPSGGTSAFSTASEAATIQVTAPAAAPPVAAPPAPTGPQSPTASDAAANVKGSTILLHFSSAVPAAWAADASRYGVTVNGDATPVAGAAYDAASQTVTLKLAAGSLQVGDAVSVTWPGGQTEVVAG